MKRFMLILVSLGMLTSCNGLFDYSPYTLNFKNDESNLNRKNAEKLQANRKELLLSDTLTIAFTGDTHRFYNEWEDFVEKVNSMPRVNLVIHTGDFTDFGLPRQYQWGARIMSSLHVPYFVTIGNHDLVGNGQQAYLEMFGSLDFSFTVGKTKVILLNTNSREFKYSGIVPNINWLRDELIEDGTFDNAIIVFHVPLNHKDFDASLQGQLIDILNDSGLVLASFHGHLHGFDSYILNGSSVPMVNTWGVEHRKITVLKIYDNGFNIENHRF